MAKDACYVVKMDLALADKLKTGLLSQGFSLSTPPYTLFSGKRKGVSCTLYQSGKLVVQGKEMGEFIEFFLEPEILGSFQYGYDQEEEVDLVARIGADESGKGDFFGPLCVSCLFADEAGIKSLQKLKVQDSKKLSDKKALELARKLKQEFPHHTLRLFPKKYNELYTRFGNLNSMLAWAHSTAIKALLEKVHPGYILIDKFAHERVMEKAFAQKAITLPLKQIHRAEQDPVVAAASILARAAFIQGMTELSEEFSIPLPKGASKEVIRIGKALVRQQGEDALYAVAKWHFKTKEEVLSS